MSSYKYFNFQKFERRAYSLVPIRKQDINKIKNWRNSQIDVLRQEKLLSDDDQLKYFNKIIKPSFSQKNPNQILFSYLYKNKCIGYGGLVHISWLEKSAEISFLLDNKYLASVNIYKRYFQKYIGLILDIAFNSLKFNKVTGETYSFRKNHINILENSGFIVKKIIKKKLLINGKYYNSVFHEIFNDKKYI